MKLLTLGDCAVYARDLRVDLPPLPYALLVYIASHEGRTIAKDELLELFWAGGASPHARHSLSQAIHLLTHRLDLPIHSSALHLQLDAGIVAVDALEFARAISVGDHQLAAKIYRGPFLHSLILRGARSIRFWIDDRRAYYSREAKRILLELARGAESTGDWPLAQRFAARALEIDPLDPEATVVLATAQAALGDRHAAYDLLARLRQRDRRHRLGYSRRTLKDLLVRLETLHTHATGANLAVSQPPFVGRGEEISQLLSAWERVSAERAAASISVAGEAGIGKTRFLDHAARMIAIRGGRVFMGRCRELEQRIAYAGVADLCSNGLRRSDTAMLQPLEARALLQLRPSLAGEPQTPYTSDQLPPLALFDGVVSVFQRIAERTPLAIFLDDAHWADEGTLTLLQYAVRRLRDHPVLLIVSFRPDELASHGPLLTLGSEGELRSIRVDLLPLAESAAVELAGRCAAAWRLSLNDGALRQLVRRASGHPLFLVESLRELASQGQAEVEHLDDLPLSGSLRDHVQHRLARLTPAARTIVDILAVLNSEATSRDVGEIAEMQPLEVAEALADAERRSIVCRTSGGFGIVHDLLRSTIYRILPAASRCLWHSRIAKFLCAKPLVSPGVLADHLFMATRYDDAFDHALKAAEVCLRSSHFADAQHYCDLAMTCARSEEDTYRAGDLRCRLLLAADRASEAADLIRQIEPWYRAKGDREGLLRIAVAKLENAMDGDANYTPALQHFDDLLSTIDQLTDLTLVGHAVASIASAAHHRGRRDVIEALLRCIVDKAATGGVSRAAAELYAVAARLHGVYGSAAEAQAAAAAAEDIAQRSRDRVTHLLALMARGVTELIYGDLERAHVAYAQAYQICQLQELRAYRDRVVGDYGWVLLELGRYDDAKVVLGEASRNMATHRVLYAIGNLCLLHFDRGEWEALSQTAGRLLDANSVLQAEWAGAAALAFKGVACIRQGSIDRVHRVAETLARIDASSRTTPAATWLTVFDSDYLRAMGHAEHAAELLIEAAERCSAAERLSRLRLMIEAASDFRTIGRDKAWRLCRDAERAAREWNAFHLANKAQEVRLRIGP